MKCLHLPVSACGEVLLLVGWVWDPFHYRFFHHNSNLIEISFSFNSITGDHIATKFGTCHDSPAVVPCAKYCSDHFISIGMRAKWNFHHIWIVMEKLLVKWAPDSFYRQPHLSEACCHSGAKTALLHAPWQIPHQWALKGHFVKHLSAVCQAAYQGKLPLPRR